MHDIQLLPEGGVVYAPAKIDFPGFEEYKVAATEIAEYIGEIELTQDNVKEVKKVLADARKVTDGLNKRRIEIKKLVNSEYQEFEKKVRELCSIIDEADQELRGKVREIEEAEREEKKANIIALWNKRAPHYKISEYFPDAWELWLTPQHLNKSVSMKHVEEDMTEWLEETEGAFNVLSGMDDEYTVEYIGCLDLKTAIQNVNDRKKIKAMFESDDEDEDDTAHFIIRGEKNITLTKLLLKDNGINFEII